MNLVPRITAITEADTATVVQLIWSMFWRVLRSFPMVPVSSRPKME